MNPDLVSLKNLNCHVLYLLAILVVMCLRGIAERLWFARSRQALQIDVIKYIILLLNKKNTNKISNFLQFETQMSSLGSSPGNTIPGKMILYILYI